MTHQKNISIIGGDLRLVYLGNKLLENYQVNCFGNEHERLSSGIRRINQLETAVEVSSLLILPIPFSKDKKHIYMPFSEEKILCAVLEKYDLSEKIIVGTAFSEEMKRYLKKRSAYLFDIGEEETFAIYNAIPTAEGVLQLLMTHLDKTIYGSKGLILGYGKCGIRQAKVLNSLRCQVTIAARDPVQLTLARLEGYQAIQVEEIAKQIETFDFIVNTIPAPILHEKTMNLIKRPMVIVDIANQMETTTENLCQRINARGIPGNYAPRTAAEVIYQVLYEKKLLD